MQLLPVECKDLLFEIRIYPDEAERYFGPLLCVLYSRLKGKGMPEIERALIRLLRTERKEQMQQLQEKRHQQSLSASQSGVELDEQLPGQLLLVNWDIRHYLLQPGLNYLFQDVDDAETKVATLSKGKSSSSSSAPKVKGKEPSKQEKKRLKKQMKRRKMRVQHTVMAGQTEA